MTIFVLILTMAFNGYGVAMPSVSGSESDAACQAAGQEWAASEKHGQSRFVCVGQTKK